MQSSTNKPVANSLANAIDPSLIQEQARSEALLMSIGDGVISTDDQGNIESINQPALNILGYSREELTGGWFPKYIVAVNDDGEEISLDERPITQAIISGRPISRRCCYRKKTGDLVPVAITVSPVLLNGRPVGAVEVFRDISNEIENEAMKDNFIYAASHQLRTPLSAVNIYCKMLAEGYVGKLSSEQQNMMQTIIASTQRMNKLIDTLLNISRIEAGKVQVSKVDIHLDELVHEVFSELEHEAEQKKLSCSLSLSKELKPVKSDPVLLKEVYSNLLSNAIKYTPFKGTVEIKLYEKDKQYIYEVKDNGLGIPKEEQARVFHKFYRATNVVSEETHGTGLGLYLVQKILEYLGGRIWFESVPNKFTRFYIALPRPVSQ